MATSSELHKFILSTNASKFIGNEAWIGDTMAKMFKHKYLQGPSVKWETILESMRFTIKFDHKNVDAPYHRFRVLQV